MVNVPQQEVIIADLVFQNLAVMDALQIKVVIEDGHVKRRARTIIN